MFVAEAPGQTEDQFATEPLIGESGQLLDRILQEVGIDRSQCSIINTVQCRPPKNRPPERDELDACAPILNHYIQQANPKIIVPLGSTALKKVCGNFKITTTNGKQLESPRYPGIKFVPVIHPSFALRDPRNVEQLRYGLKKVKELADSIVTGQPLNRKGKVIYIDTLDKFKVMIKDLISKPYFALDIETTSFRFLHGEIISIGFSNTKGLSYVLPWVIGDEEFYRVCKSDIITSKKRSPITDIKEFCNLYKLNVPKFFWEGTEVKDTLRALLSYPKIAKILHNHMFDCKFLDAAGLTLEGQIYDTMIMHHMLDEQKGYHGLDDCCLRFTDYGEYWKGLDKYLVSTDEAKDTYAIIPIEELAEYNGTDADVTLQIFEIFHPMLEAEDPKFLPLLNTFLMPVAKMLMDTERNGCLIDEACRKTTEDILTKEIERLDIKLKEFTSNFVPTPSASQLKTKKIPTELNFNSSDQLAEFLFKHLNLPVINKTEKGKSSTDGDTLEVLAKLHEFPRLLLDRRKKQKLLSTYVIGIKSQIWLDGKVHPNFNICGTETGRLSSSNPNAQNYPKNNDALIAIGVNIKNMYIISDPDYVMVETDYSQAELRLIAEYSRDKNLYKAFKEQRDPHAELAVRLYHKDRIAEMEAGTIVAKDIVTDEERQRGKTANFSLCYGKMPKNFAEEEGIPYEEAVYIYNVFWQTYEDIARWREEKLQEARMNGSLQSFFGRKRRSKKINHTDQFLRGEAERELLNFVIQSQASDYTLYSTLKVLKICKEKGIRAKTMLFVHDSAVYMVHRDDLQAFLTILQDTMAHPPGITITMESDVKVGTRWGSLKKWFCNNGLWQEKAEKAKVAA
jgi:DNA polymerase-1